MIVHWFESFRTAIAAGLILLATFLIALAFNYFVGRYITRAIRTRHIDPTSSQFARHVVTAVIYIVGFGLALVQIPEMRIVGHSMLAGAGIISLVAGLASQQALSNVMSGILIVLFKPFKIGDRVQMPNSFTGTVEDINLRQVVLCDADNNRIIVPNSVIGTAAIINKSLNDPRVCQLINVSLAYTADVAAASDLLRGIIMAHPRLIDHRTPEETTAGTPQVVVRLTELGPYAVNLRAWAWAKDDKDAFQMLCDVLMEVKTRFPDRQIPLAHRERAHA